MAQTPEGESASGRIGWRRRLVRRHASPNSPAWLIARRGRSLWVGGSSGVLRDPILGGDPPCGTKGDAGRWLVHRFAWSGVTRRPSARCRQSRHRWLVHRWGGFRQGVETMCATGQGCWGGGSPLARRPARYAPVVRLPLGCSFLAWLVRVGLGVARCDAMMLQATPGGADRPRGRVGRARRANL